MSIYKAPISLCSIQQSNDSEHKGETYFGIYK